MKRCRDCKHYEPKKDLNTLWGLLRTESYYHEFAKCSLADGAGYKSYCSTQRLSNWTVEGGTCDRSGKGWEPKHE